MRYYIITIGVGLLVSKEWGLIEGYKGKSIEISALYSVHKLFFVPNFYRIQIKNRFCSVKLLTYNSFEREGGPNKWLQFIVLGGGQGKKIAIEYFFYQMSHSPLS